MNTAIWIGLIALIGIAEDDGVVIATYMEQLFSRRPLRTFVRPRWKLAAAASGLA